MFLLGCDLGMDPDTWYACKIVSHACDVILIRSDLAIDRSCLARVPVEEEEAQQHKLERVSPL